METDINNYVTRGRINNASFRQKRDPISKNIMRRQNPFEIAFEDTSTFDAENPIVGSLLKEIDIGKKDIASELIKNAPRPPGIDSAIRNRLNKLKDRREPKDNNNNNFLPPPPPSHASFFSQRPPSGTPPAPPFVLPRSGNFLQPFQPPDDYFLLTPPPKFTPTNNLFGSQTQTLTREKEEIKDEVQKELDDKIYELPDDLPKLEHRDGLASILAPETEDILDENFVNKKTSCQGE